MLLKGIFQQDVHSHIEILQRVEFVLFVVLLTFLGTQVINTANGQQYQKYYGKQVEKSLLGKWSPEAIQEI